MQEAVPNGKGSMIAVMGLTLNDLNKFIREINNRQRCMRGGK